MSKVQMLRALVNERLTAAVEDICGVFEITIAEYEEEVSRLKKVNIRQEKLLDAILKPQIQLNRTDPQQLFVCKEEVSPEQQEWSPSLGQEDPEPPHIKEEQEDLIQGLAEAEVQTLTLLPEKSENNEEEQSSQLNPTQSEDNREAEPLANTSAEQIKMEPDGENCGVSEPASNSAGDLEPTSDGQLLSSDCYESKTEDSDDGWKETREPQSGLNTLKSKKTQRVEGQSLSVGKKLRSMEPSNELKPSNQIPSLVGCKMCGKSFPIRNSLMSPAMVYSRDFGYCGKHLEPRESPKLHFEVHRTCNVCSKKGKSITELEQHMSFHTRQKPFSCTTCGKGFSQNRYLKKHMITHTGDKPFRCIVCEKLFTRKQALKVHMRSHTGEKPFSCTVCEKCFSQKCDLKKHMLTHTGDKPFSCIVCEKGFTQQPTLKRHMRSHTGEKPFSCILCEKAFSRKQTLKRHIRSHTGDKPFSCIVCEKVFTRKQALKVHMRSHTGEKPFSCTVCEKRFGQKCDVKKHMITHTGDKPFSCIVCENVFSQKQTLKRHMRSHTGEKPFSCILCEKAFSRKHTLKRHMRSHTGEKPFSCTVCGKCFNQKFLLEKHMITHAGEKPFRCTVSVFPTELDSTCGGS